MPVVTLIGGPSDGERAEIPDHHFATMSSLAHVAYDQGVPQIKGWYVRTDDWSRWQWRVNAELLRREQGPAREPTP